MQQYHHARQTEKGLVVLGSIELKLAERRVQLSDLLKQAEQLTADIQTSREGLPNVKRNLQQIAEAGQRLLDKTSGVLDESTDVKA